MDGVGQNGGAEPALSEVEWVFRHALNNTEFQGPLGSEVRCTLTVKPAVAKGFTRADCVRKALEPSQHYYLEGVSGLSFPSSNQHPQPDAILAIQPSRNNRNPHQSPL